MLLVLLVHDVQSRSQSCSCRSAEYLRSTFRCIVEWNYVTLLPVNENTCSGLWHWSLESAALYACVLIAQLTEVWQPCDVTVCRWQMSSQLMKAAKVTLTNCLSATSTVGSKATTAAVPCQSAVVSAAPSQPSTSAAPSQPATAVKQKPVDAGSAALNRTFQKESTCNSLVLSNCFNFNETLKMAFKWVNEWRIEHQWNSVTV